MKKTLSLGVAVTAVAAAIMFGSAGAASAAHCVDTEATSPGFSYFGTVHVKMADHAEGVCARTRRHRRRVQLQRDLGQPVRACTRPAADRLLPVIFGAAWASKITGRFFVSGARRATDEQRARARDRDRSVRVG